MPSVRKSLKESQREELATLLGEPVFLRDEAASKIGLTPATMKTEPHNRPPFFQKKDGGTVFYPQSWLDEFKRNGKVVSPVTGKMMTGKRPWPPVPPTSTSPTPVAPKKRVNRAKQANAIGLLNRIGETNEEHRKKVSEGWPD